MNNNLSEQAAAILAAVRKLVSAAQAAETEAFNLLRRAVKLAVYNIGSKEAGVVASEALTELPKRFPALTDPAQILRGSGLDIEVGRHEQGFARDKTQVPAVSIQRGVPRWNKSACIVMQALWKKQNWDGLYLSQFCWEKKTAAAQRPLSSTDIVKAITALTKRADTQGFQDGEQAVLATALAELRRVAEILGSK